MSAIAELTPTLTPKEVAQHLRMSVKKVRRLCKERQLDALNTSEGSKQARWIIEAAALERFKLRLVTAAKRPQPQRRPAYEQLI